MLNIHEVMTGLAKTRPIFHSEADFQFALAWQIREMMPDSQIRLEFKPFPDGRMYLDIWIRDQEMAIELKYLHRKLEREYDSEQFILREQSAQDLGRHGFLKDIARVESVVRASVAKCGFAVLLTNDPSYWDERRWIKRDSNDAAFRIHEGRVATGELAWLNPTAGGTLSLRGLYNLHWKDFSEVLGTRNYDQFRYLAVFIGE